MGIEPKSTEPESVILSIELQVRGAMVFCPFGRVSLCKDTKIFIIREQLYIIICTFACFFMIMWKYEETFYDDCCSNDGVLNGSWC